MKYRFLLLPFCLIGLVLLSCYLPYLLTYTHTLLTYQGKSAEYSNVNKSNKTEGKSHLIFDDEFSGSSLDSTRWNVMNRVDPTDRTLDRYIPENISVSQGNLVLKSERDFSREAGYTSGEVDSSWKFSFTYGKVEIRAKMPQSGQGIWPALWLLGDNCNAYFCDWPAAGANEIDIVEQINEPYTIHMNAHYGLKPSIDLGSHTYTRHGTIDYSDAYHLFSLTWSRGGNLTWYIDGVQQDHREIPGYFNTPMHLVLNTAIGGNWPGSPDASTPFPQYLSIDYVRVYQ